MRLRALFPFARRICWVLRSILLAALIFSDLMKEPTSNGNLSGAFACLKLECDVQSGSWSFGEGRTSFLRVRIGVLAATLGAWLEFSVDAGRKSACGEFASGLEKKVI